MSVFVLEGPDLAGKSTLAATLRTFLEGNRTPGPRTVQLVHNGPPDLGRNLFASYVAQVASAIERAEQSHTIFDRLHVGELMYGPHYRGASQLLRSQATAIDEMLAGAGAILVHVDAPDETLLDRFHGERGEDLVTLDVDLLNFAHRYRQLLDPKNPDAISTLWKQWIPNSDLETFLSDAGFAFDQRGGSLLI